MNYPSAVSFFSHYRPLRQILQLIDIAAALYCSIHLHSLTPQGTVLALALLFRPEFAVGYIAFVAVAIAVVVVLSILLVAACFVLL